MDEEKKPDEKPMQKKVTIVIPGQQSATDTSNWDDKTFGTPKGRDMLPNMIEEKDRLPVHIDPASRKKRKKKE